MSKYNREDKIRKDVALFYDNVAQKFSDTRRNWWSNLDFIKKYLKKNDRLLDFGCGNGRLLEFIYSENLKIDYTGIDISEELIEIAKSHYVNEKFFVIQNEGDSGQKKNKFDLVVSIAVFHHFTPQMAEDALKEMRRVLKKDGVVVITAWHLWNKKRLPFLLKAFWRKVRKLDFEKTADLPFSYSDKKEGEKTFWRFCYWWGKRELEKKIQKNGFEILESGYSRDQRNQKRNIFIVAEKS